MVQRVVVDLAEQHVARTAQALQQRHRVEPRAAGIDHLDKHVIDIGRGARR